MSLLSSGIIGLIILGVCVILFVTEWLPSAVTGCLGCILMVLFHVCSFDDAFSGFSSSIVLLMFGAMTVGIAMFDTGVAQAIGRQVIRLSNGNERVFLLIAVSVSSVLAMFLANTAVLAMFLTIIDSVCSTSTNMKRKDLTLPVALGVMFGGACTLVGCTPQLAANGIMQKMTGMEMGMFDLTRPGICILILYIIYVQFFGFKLGKKIWGDRPDEAMDLGPDRNASAMDKSYDQKKFFVMLCIIALMIIFYIGAWISTAMTAICAALLCVLAGCTNVKSIIKNMNWECVIFLAACLGLANGLTASGAGDLLSEIFSNLLGDVASPFIVFAVLVLVVTIISEFITNSAAIIIVLPIALSVCSAYGFNYMAFCLGITFGASFACSTPLAAAQIAMTLVAGYKFSDFIKYTVILDIITYAGILIFVPLFYPLMG